MVYIYKAMNKLSSIKHRNLYYCGRQNM